MESAAETVRGLGVGDYEGLWYEGADAVWARVAAHAADGGSVDLEEVESMGEAVLEKMSTAKGKKRGDHSFAEAMVNKGTISDQLAAMSVLLQEQPLKHRLMLDRLLNAAKRPARRIAVMAMESLGQLFVETLLPEKRKLRRLRAAKTVSLLNQCFSSSNSRQKKEMALWAVWEDWLKVRFAEFVGVLENLLGDALDWVRLKALNVASNILKNRPEGEQVLLTLLVNKLGDTSGKVSSKAMSELLSFVQPGKEESAGVIPNPALQTVLMNEVESVLFRTGATSSARFHCIVLLSQFVLSTGLDSSLVLARKLVELYLRVFRQVSAVGKGSKKKEAEKAMQSRLLGGILTGISRALPYAMDSNGQWDAEESLGPHLDSLFRAIHESEWPAVVQALSVVHQLASSTGGSISSRFFRALYGVLGDAGSLQRFHDCGTKSMPLFFNVLYRSLKSEDTSAVASPETAAATVKRALQMALHSPSNISAAVALLVSKLQNHQPVLRSLVKLPEEAEDDAEFYDSEKRNPEFSKAHRSCLWEALFLASFHFHPSVRKFAEDIINEEEIGYDGDPLKDFGPIALLDKFIGKNPKAEIRERAQKRLSSFDRKINTAPGLSWEVALGKKQGQVAPEDVVFAKFFEKMKSKNKKTAQEEDDEGSAENSVEHDANSEDEEEEAFAQKMFEQELLAAEGSKMGQLNDDYDGSDAEGESKSVEDLPDADETFGDEEIDESGIGQSLIPEEEEEEGEDLIPQDLNDEESVDDDDSDEEAFNYADSGDDQEDEEGGKRSVFASAEELDAIISGQHKDFQHLSRKRKTRPAKSSTPSAPPKNSKKKSKFNKFKRQKKQ